MDVIEISSTRNRSRSMLMKFAVVFAKMTLSVNVEAFLITEEDDPSGRNETRQVIFLRIGELGEVHAMDFCANFGVVIEDIGGIGEEVTKLRITLNTFILIGNLCQWLPVNIGEDWAKAVVHIVRVILDTCTARFVDQVILPLYGRLRGDERSMHFSGDSICMVRGRLLLEQWVIERRRKDNRSAKQRKLQEFEIWIFISVAENGM
jgi:hypothetical protein